MPRDPVETLWDEEMRQASRRRLVTASPRLEPMIARQHELLNLSEALSPIRGAQESGSARAIRYAMSPASRAVAGAAVGYGLPGHRARNAVEGAAFGLAASPANLSRLALALNNPMLLGMAKRLPQAGYGLYAGTQ